MNVNESGQIETRTRTSIPNDLQRILSGKYYDQQHLYDRNHTDSISLPGFEADFILSYPFDKIFTFIDQAFPVDSLDVLTDKIKTNKLLKLTPRKKYVFSKKFTAIISNDYFQLTILSNSSSCEIQANGKDNSFEFLQELHRILFPGKRPKIVRLDPSLDIRRSMKYLKDNLRILNKRSVRSLDELSKISSIDSKTGTQFIRIPGTEYHGKNREIAIYNSGKIHCLGKDVSRIEVRHRTMRVMPIRYLDELHLIKDKKIFSDIKLPIEISTIELTNKEKHYRGILEAVSKSENCSPSMAMKILKADAVSDSRTLIDSCARALRKSEIGYFDLDSVFNHNLDLFLKSKMSEHEVEFLCEIKKCLK